MRQIRVDANLFLTETIPQERQTIISIQQQYWHPEYCDTATTTTAATTTTMTSHHSWFILIQSFVSNFLVQLQWEEQSIIRILYPTLDSIYHHCGDTTMTSSSIHDNTNPTSANNNNIHAGDAILQIIHGLRRTTFQQQHQFRRGIEILQQILDDDDDGHSSSNNNSRDHGIRDRGIGGMSSSTTGAAIMSSLPEKNTTR
jgi:hypothetical protein